MLALGLGVCSKHKAHQMYGYEVPRNIYIYTYIHIYIYIHLGLK